MVSFELRSQILEGASANDVGPQSLSDSKKRLALSIIDFLSTSLKDGTLTADDAENVEVASSCIADAFKVDPNDKAAVSDAVGTQSLFSIYSVYEKLKGKSTASTTGKSSASEARPATPSAKPADTKPPNSGSAINPEAEKLKSAGNAAMQQKDYKTAIEKYTQAISYSPTNPIYLSNRAAAYSASGDHVAAAADAEIAVASDPKYTKAWSRLGLAKFAMGDAKGSAEAYQKGIEYEGSGGSEAMRKGLETAKKRVAEMEQEEGDLPEDDVDDASGASRGGAGGGMPDLASLAGMFGGGGRGGGGGGGMPDIAGLMNNPMFAGMARNLMQNPEALSGLMNNPRIAEMMQGMQGGGGMPDMSQLRGMMNDPAVANL
jgi:small glutamine-rich tetratricopeptide repeat-containing protein alpha